MELGKGVQLDDYQHELVEFGLNIPVFEVDARQRNDITMLVQALLYCVDPGLTGEAA